MGTLITEWLKKKKKKEQEVSNYWVVLLRGKLSDPSDFDLSFTEIAWRNFSTP